jgi:transcriptional regulator of acetoin/glycerol metabolism
MLDTIRTNQSLFEDPDQKQLVLRWLSPDSARPVVPITSDFHIGRDPSCGAQLDGEGVSRVHAELRRDGDHFVLVDNHSTNGTFLGGQAIREQRIAPGMVLRVGSWIGLFEARSRNAAVAPSFDIGAGLRGGITLRAAVEPARRAAPSSLPIIVCGETGTGKEVVSRAIHAWSGRAGEFCAINCAALPEQLVEGELFGYRRGAFTGAERNSLGYFRRADRGTLLLDEINELPQSTQAKLLRVLQEQELVPLGESQPVSIDVRVIVAAQASIADAVVAKRFREDLYMRLRGLELTLPPLRERIGDVPELFRGFLAEHGRGAAPPVEPRLVEALCLYAWPGNVRELEIVARRLLAVHGTEPSLRRRFLPEHMVITPPSTRPVSETPVDLPRLAAALWRAQGNLTKACAELQISRQRAYRLMDGATVKDVMAQHPDER